MIKQFAFLYLVIFYTLLSHRSVTTHYVDGEYLPAFNYAMHRQIWYKYFIVLARFPKF